MLSTQEVNALGQILDTTFRSGNGYVSINHHLQDTMLVLTYQTIVHFASEQSLQVQVRRLAEESTDLMSQYVTNVKKEFKDSTGIPLKLKELLDRDNIELVSATSNSPRKIAYYRRQFELAVEN